MPNPPDGATPDGSTDDDAVELRRVGEPPEFGFEIRDHTALGTFEIERGARLSGSRFAYRVGGTALVELALYRYALDALVAHGHVPMLPPVLVREEAMYGTGFLPTERVNIYRLEADELYLTGTSEVALAGYHMGEILDGGRAAAPLRRLLDLLPPRGGRGRQGHAGDLPRPPVRQGRDVRLLRAASTRARSTSGSSPSRRSIVRGLGLPYRVVNVAAGDLGPSAAKKYDIEAWIPSQGRYREITSCSNTTDYQARRLGSAPGRRGAALHPHTLNGTAMTARFLLALLENFQDEGGSVAIPPALVALGAPAVLRR